MIVEHALPLREGYGCRDPVHGRGSLRPAGLREVKEHIGECEGDIPMQKAPPLSPAGERCLSSLRPGFGRDLPEHGGEGAVCLQGQFNGFVKV